jgi:hypothetical protein
MLAFALGLVLSLYRNGLLRTGARSAGLEPAYLRFERAVGGPGFGTPRAVEELTIDLGAPSSTPAAR